MALEDVSRLLATKKYFMFAFMDRYIFDQIVVDRREALSNTDNFMKMIDHAAPANFLNSLGIIISLAYPINEYEHANLRL